MKGHPLKHRDRVTACPPHHDTLGSLSIGMDSLLPVVSIPESVVLTVEEKWV